MSESENQDLMGASRPQEQQRLDNPAEDANAPKETHLEKAAFQKAPAPQEPQKLDNPAEDASATEVTHLEEEASQEAPAPQETDYEKEFTLRYKIELEDYFTFHKISGRPAVEKARKKTTILGWVEAAVGVIFLLVLPMKRGESPMFSIIIAIMLILMGVYGIIYYKYLYDRALRRALKKQRARTPYLQNEIVIDFYPNKFVEYNDNKNFETFWHSIKDVRVSDTLFMVMLTETRCLLVPKSSIPGEVEMFDTFLRRICADFEKPRVEV